MKLLVLGCIIAVVNGMSKEDICSLDPDNGGCSSYSQMYFFNRFTGQCHEFVYRGCLGNKNLFETREECESFCEGMALDKKPDCMKKPDEGPCSGLIFRYYYDPEEMTCNMFKYGGCKGNANSFKSVEDCMDTCYEGPEDSV